ncbi:MAG: DUF885 domain-containing protein, partial [Polyangiaceae bacterium]
MRKGALALALIVMGCGPATPSSTVPAPTPVAAPAPVPAAQDFASYRDGLVDAWLKRKPAMARQAGLHEHDGVIADYSPKGIAADVAFFEEARQELAGYDAATLSDGDALDLAILQNRVALELEELVEQDQPHTSPLFYQELYRVSRYVNFDYAPVLQRIEKLVAHQEAALTQTQHLLAAMKPVLSRPLVKTSITIYKGHASYLKGDLKTLVERELEDGPLKERFAKSNAALAVAAAEVAERLEKEWLPRADEKSHVLGREGFARFVKAQEGRAIPLETFEAMAEKDLARNKAAYEALAKKVKVTRPQASALLETATDLMNASRQFVIDRDLISIPSDDRCKLEETPPFMRWNAAFLNMAGPFDAAKEAYYYITLPDPSWPKAEQEGYIFPHGVLSSTTIHEVYPGHFLHGLFIRQAPSRVQKLFDSYSFTEGWAHYVEEMMIEEGWAEKEPRRHLGQLSDALLRNCRFVAALALHAKGHSLEQVAERFEKDCFQDKATAREQAVRGTFDPGYFAYT